MDEPSNLKKQKHPHTPITLLYVLLICSDEYEKYSFSSVPWNSKPSHIIPCHTMRMTSDKKYAQFLHFYKNRLDMQCNVNNDMFQYSNSRIIAIDVEQFYCHSKVKKRECWYPLEKWRIPMKQQCSQKCVIDLLIFWHIEWKCTDKKKRLPIISVFAIGDTHVKVNT